MIEISLVYLVAARRLKTLLAKILLQPVIIGNCDIIPCITIICPQAVRLAMEKEKHIFSFAGDNLSFSHVNRQVPDDFKINIG